MSLLRNAINGEDWGFLYDLVLGDKVLAEMNKFRLDLTYAYNRPWKYKSDGWKLSFKGNMAKEIRLKFVENVEQIVEVMKAENTPPNTRKVVPDRHRISAALLVAILQAAPYVSEPPEGNSLLLPLRLPNETLALRLAESFLISQIMNTVRKEGQKGEIVLNHLEKYDNLIEPNLNIDNGKPVRYLGGKYKRHLTYALHHALGEGTVNVFFLAQILFWLEWNTLEKLS